MSNFTYRLKKHYAFDNEELWGLGLTILVATIVCSTFNNWSQSELLLNFLAVILAVFVHQSGHRLRAAQLGYKVKFHVWYTGIALSLFLFVIFNGWVVIILPGTVLVYMLERERVGKYKYEITYKDINRIILAGALANLFLAVFFKYLLSYGIFNDRALEIMIRTNVIFAISSFIPEIRLPTTGEKFVKHPVTDGIQMFYPYWFKTLSFLVMTLIISFFLLYSNLYYSTILWIGFYSLVAMFLIFIYLYFDNKIK